MQLSISASAALGVVVLVLVRSGGLKAVHAVVCILLGFYLAESSIAPTIDDATRSAARMLAGIDL